MLGTPGIRCCVYIAGNAHYQIGRRCRTWQSIRVDCTWGSLLRIWYTGIIPRDGEGASLSVTQCGTGRKTGVIVTIMWPERNLRPLILESQERKNERNDELFW